MVTFVESDKTAPGFNFVSFERGDKGRVVAFDFNGNMRAAFANSGMSRIAPLENGHLAFHTNNLMHGIYFYDGFVEVDMMGKVYKKYLINGIHHEFIKLENGNWLIDSERPDGDTTEDYFIELDAETGMFVRDWWLKDSFQFKDNLYRGNPAYKYNEVDWAHVNSFVQVPGEDAILFSPRHNDGVYKLNLTTHEIEWAIAEDDPDFTEDFSAKRLTPVITQEDGTVITVDEWWVKQGNEPIDWSNPKDPYFQQENVPFEYTYGQHAVSILPNGDIFVFDNGNGRSKVEANLLDASENYSRGVIYRYNETDKTVEQVWQYGRERGAELYCMYICDVDYLGEGHYLMDFGGVGGPASVNSQARVIEYADGQVINEMKITANCYRAERLAPYAGLTGESYELNKVKGQQLGTMLMERAKPVDPNHDTIYLTIGSRIMLVNGKSVVNDVTPLITNDRTFLPVRATAEALNATVDYVEDGTITIKSGETTIVMKVGETAYSIQGEAKAMDVAPYITDSRTMVPTRFIAEGLGATVEAVAHEDGSTKGVTIVK